MKCYFLRHGIAVEPAEWNGRDFDRPLTREGEKRMEREAAAIAALLPSLDAIVTSPLLRAKQTATIVATRLKLTDRLVEDKRVANGFNAEGLENLLRDHSGADALMIVGHEPSLSMTIGHLIGDAQVEVKKGALACVEIRDSAASGGVLLYLLPPKVLAALT